jgi:CheY-like chemotaxis protein
MNCRVLVVDDDRDHADSIADVLALHGYAVEVAHSGEEAVERFQAADFDVTLMDVRLPGMNGVETFCHFRRVKPGAPVLMMTGFSVEQLLAQAVEGGAAGVLHKPFAAHDLIRAIERVKPRGLVLVADDDANFAASAAKVLARHGYAVEVAETGQEALEKVQAAAVDCLVLDLQLPVLSGIETYLTLRRSGHAVPTVLVTGYACEERDALERTRMDRLLIKPFDPAMLVEAVRQATGRGRGAEAV